MSSTSEAGCSIGYPPKTLQNRARQIPSVHNLFYLLNVFKLLFTGDIYARFQSDGTTERLVMGDWVFPRWKLSISWLRCGILYLDVAFSFQLLASWTACPAARGRQTAVITELLFWLALSLLWLHLWAACNRLCCEFPFASKLGNNVRFF